MLGAQKAYRSRRQAPNTGKWVSWIAKEALMPVKVEYFDKRGKKVKQYRAGKLEKIDGIWTAIEYEMHDLKREHRTLMKLTEGEIQCRFGGPHFHKNLFAIRQIAGHG